MKNNRIFAFFMAGMALSFTACNNSGDNTASASDSNNTDNTAVNTGTSSGDYGAMADNIEKNSTLGYYINPKTGKAYTKLTVDRSTGEITDENNEPVWHYVDNRNWWVYGVDDGDWQWHKMGEAKMDKDHLVYKDDNTGNWISYDQRWKADEENINKTWKTKSGDIKIKFDKDGDIKVKDEDGKVKYDSDDNKIKVDSSK
jgi:hypothetical protein